MTDTRARILVVDDDLCLRDLLQRNLGEQGFAFHAVADSTGMDKALERGEFDLLVLDLMLPGEDGLAICRRLRAGGSDIGLIMLTAKSDDIDRIVGL
jgi:two-component system phosphate regulon response regulator OmpR